VEHADGKPAEDARVRVRSRQELSPKWRDLPAHVDDHGRYWKILVPGPYDVQAFVPNTQLRSNVVSVVVQNELRPTIQDLVVDERGEEFDTEQSDDDEFERVKALTKRNRRRQRRPQRPISGRPPPTGR